jgi:hypothetical protein
MRRTGTRAGPGTAACRTGRLSGLPAPVDHITRKVQPWQGTPAPRDLRRGAPASPFAAFPALSRSLSGASLPGLRASLPAGRKRRTWAGGRPGDRHGGPWDEDSGTGRARNPGPGHGAGNLGQASGPEGGLRAMSGPQGRERDLWGPARTLTTPGPKTWTLCRASPTNTCWLELTCTTYGTVFRKYGQAQGILAGHCPRGPAGLPCPGHGAGELSRDCWPVTGPQRQVMGSEPTGGEPEEPGQFPPKKPVPAGLLNEGPCPVAVSDDTGRTGRPQTQNSRTEVAEPDHGKWKDRPRRTDALDGPTDGPAPQDGRPGRADGRTSRAGRTAWEGRRTDQSHRTDGLAGATVRKDRMQSQDALGVATVRSDGTRPQDTGGQGYGDLAGPRRGKPTSSGPGLPPAREGSGELHRKPTGGSGPSGPVSTAGRADTTALRGGTAQYPLMSRWTAVSSPVSL